MSTVPKYKYIYIFVCPICLEGVDAGEPGVLGVLGVLEPGPDFGPKQNTTNSYTSIRVLEI